MNHLKEPNMSVVMPINFYRIKEKNRRGPKAVNDPNLETDCSLVTSDLRELYRRSRSNKNLFTLSQISAIKQEELAAITHAQECREVHTKEEKLTCHGLFRLISSLDGFDSIRNH